MRLTEPLLVRLKGGWKEDGRNEYGRNEYGDRRCVQWVNVELASVMVASFVSREMIDPMFFLILNSYKFIQIEKI